MRVVSGRFKGRALASERGHGVRPTSDRVRESIFNVLIHRNGTFDINGARVIDLFAGTGALGLEALSRGASYALFVETAASRRAVIRSNIDTLAVGGLTRILKRDARDLGKPVGSLGFTLAFLDPPYGHGFAEPALMSLANGGWLTHGAMVVIEETAYSELSLSHHYEIWEARTIGDTRVTFALYDGQGRGPKPQVDRLG